MVKKLFLVVIMAVVLVLMGSFAKAAYDDVQYVTGDGVLISLNAGTINLKVISGSVASTTVTADGDSVIFRMSTSSQISFTNTDRKILTNSWNVNTICTNSDSQITLTATSSLTLADVTVSIGGNCPAIDTGGGGTPNPAPVVLPVTPPVTPDVTPPVTPPVTPDVTPPVVKPISEMTVPELQAEITRITALINQLIASIGTVAIEPTTGKITKVLKYGMDDAEVTLLQTWLAKDSEVYPEGIVSGWFGSLTKAAVIKFQDKFANEVLTPLGLSGGTGLVGASTRAKLNSLFGQ